MTTEPSPTEALIADARGLVTMAEFSRGSGISMPTTQLEEMVTRLCAALTTAQAREARVLGQNAGMWNSIEAWGKQAAANGHTGLGLGWERAITDALIAQARDRSNLAEARAALTEAEERADETADIVTAVIDAMSGPGDGPTRKQMLQGVVAAMTKVGVAKVKAAREAALVKARTDALEEGRVEGWNEYIEEQAAAYDRIASQADGFAARVREMGSEERAVRHDRDAERNRASAAALRGQKRALAVPGPETKPDLYDRLREANRESKG